ncbi:MAG: transcription antitermination factor NusB [Oscillospiraceae bacterium]|jgi:N utilization substance protein B|nr:transcription antitermination factor NusB [Oscillospiraceae bacterium]
MARSTAREAAMQLIYAHMMGGGGDADALTALTGWLPDGDDDAYLRDVLDGTLASLSDLDARIDAFSRDWSVLRMARVDLAILRLAIYEMLHRPDVPPAVAINEAVELSHRFSTEAAGPFINGILGNLHRADIGAL